MDTRYQFQPWYVKCYRWLRWKPLYAFRAYKMWYLASGGSDDDWLTIWRANMSIADMAMENWHTIQEILDGLDS